MFLKQNIVKRYHDNRLRLRIAALTIAGILFVCLPINLYFLYTNVMEKGNARYEDMVYRTIEIENEVRRVEYVSKIDSNFLRASTARNETIQIYDRTEPKYVEYVNPETVKNPASMFEKKFASFVINILAGIFKPELKERGLSTYTNPNNKYQYAVLNYKFEHNNHKVSVKVIRNVTSVVIKPIRGFMYSLYISLLWYIIIGSIVGYVAVSITFRPLGRALDNGFREIEETNYEARFTITGKYGKEITSVKLKINEILEKMNEIVEKNIESIQDVSHEVNTHLTSIKQSVDVIRLYGNNNPKILEDRLNSIDTNIIRMSSIMSTILDLAKLNQGSIKADIKTYSARELVEGFINHYRKVYPDFVFITKYNLVDSNLDIDRDHFFLALKPIIENAVKYSSERSKCILVAISSKWEENDIRIAVRNRGDYIPPEEIPHIFERHYRGKSNAKQGSGLGLTITKKVMDLYDGNIEVASSPVGLTTFTLIFQREPNSLKDSGI